MNYKLFIIINFVVAFISDLILNVLSRSPYNKYHDSNIINSLHTYFMNKSYIEAGIYAGLTIITALIVLMYISKLLFNNRVALNTKYTYYYLLLAFIIGYIFDILIEKLNIFSGLEEYYKLAGVGLWGALAFLFSIIISYIIYYGLIQ